MYIEGQRYHTVWFYYNLAVLCFVCVCALCVCVCVCVCLCLCVCLCVCCLISMISVFFLALLQKKESPVFILSIWFPQILFVLLPASYLYKPLSLFFLSFSFFSFSVVILRRWGESRWWSLNLGLPSPSKISFSLYFPCIFLGLTINPNHLLKMIIIIIIETKKNQQISYFDSLS